MTIDTVAFDRRFGDHCKNNRKALGLSQDEVCDELSHAGIVMCQDVYSRIEMGLRSVRLVEAIALSAILNIDLTAFFLSAASAAVLHYPSSSSSRGLW